jgi:outer membrane lipoprotein-sorting protein
MKMMAAAFFIVFWLFFPGFGNAPAAEKANGKTLEKIRQAMAGIQTLRGDFIEEKRWVMFKEPARLSGRFYYVRPDRLRWEYLSPAPQGFAVSNGQGIQWRADAPRATPFNLDTAPVIRAFVEQVRSWIQGDFEKIRKRYRIIVAPNAPISVVLTPRGQAEKAFLDRLLILFSSDLRHVQSIQIHEKNGDASRIRFFRIRINAPVDPELFP